MSLPIWINFGKTSTKTDGVIVCSVKTGKNRTSIRNNKFLCLCLLPDFRENRLTEVRALLWG